MGGSFYGSCPAPLLPLIGRVSAVSAGGPGTAVTPKTAVRQPPTTNEPLCVRKSNKDENAEGRITLSRTILKASRVLLCYVVGE